MTNTQTSTPAPSLADLAAGAKPTRNRAVDFYRAVAMLAVSFGHWAAISMGIDSDGALAAGNALEFAPNLATITWFMQVMPLFFVVGGFSSAVSLDAHTARDGRPQDWVVARLRRMLAPTAVLGASWLAIIALASAFGFGDYAVLGFTAAAIPLWFLANYTIDTAIAPYVLPLFRRNPKRFVFAAGAVFLAVEGLRFASVPYIPQINWVLGWLLFQVAGFAWRDGLLPTGRALLTWAGGLWVAAVAAVAVGPWPVSMVNFPGLENSPTAPPSLALMLFGLAYSATAVAAAPRVSRYLANHVGAWKAVVAANSVALSVYLWHFTAAVAAGAILYGLGWLPTAAVGTAAWWLQKMPLIGLALVLLAGIVSLVSKVERKALLAPRQGWKGGEASMLAAAIAVSASVKVWTHGSGSEMAIAGCAVLCLVWRFALQPQAVQEPALQEPALQERSDAASGANASS